MTADPESAQANVARANVVLFFLDYEQALCNVIKALEIDPIKRKRIHLV